MSGWDCPCHAEGAPPWYALRRAVARAWGLPPWLVDDADVSEVALEVAFALMEAG